MFSYDIFDTLIKRKCGLPQNIFLAMQNEIGSISISGKGLESRFCDLRVEADRIARRYVCKNGVEDITINDIYCAMNHMGWIPSEEIDRFINFEKRIELENAIPIEENIDIVKKKLSDGEKVIAISDMYLDSCSISKLFDKCDIPPIKIYVSSETKKCKWTGNMYRFIRDKESVDYTEWSHLGDNSLSDVDIPSKLGIEAVHYINMQEINAIKGHIVIYGAGKLGTQMYSYFVSDSKCQIVGWSDKKFEEYRQKGLPVISPTQINKLRFDYLIIAIVDQNVCFEIEKYLLSMGVCADKIRFINSFI